MPDIDIIIKATNRASGPLKDVGNDIDKLGNKAGNVVSKGIGQLQHALGVGLKVAAGAAVVAIGALSVVLGKSIMAAVDFEQSIADIQAVMGKTAPSAKELNDAIQSIALDPKLKVNATEAAAAVNMLAKNGITWEEISGGMLRSTVLLANATGGDYALAADVATDMMVNFNKSAEDMTDVMNGIIGVTQQSKFDLNDYALASAMASGVAGAFGVTLEDFNAVLAATSSSFAGGSDAGTSFKVFLQRLVPDTAPAKEAMRELGLLTDEGGNAFFDASGKMESMSTIAGELANATAGLSDEQKIQTLSTIFGTDAQRMALAMATAGADKLREVKQLNADTSAEDAAATRMDTLRGSWEIFIGVVETLSIQLGQAFLPIVRDVVDWLTKMATEQGPKVIEWATGFADSIAIVISKLNPAVDVAGNLKMAVYDLFGPTVGGMISVVIDFVSNFARVVQNLFTDVKTFEDDNPFVVWLMHVGDYIRDTVVPAIGNFINVAIDLAKYIGAVVVAGDPLNDWITHLPEGIQPLVKALGYVIEHFRNVGLAILDFVTGNATLPETLGKIWESVTGVATNMFNLLIKVVTDNWPVWKAKLLEWGTAAWQWIVDTFPLTATKFSEWWTIIQTAMDKHFLLLEKEIGEWKALILELWGITTQEETETTFDEWFAKFLTHLGTGKTGVDAALNLWAAALVEWLTDAIPATLTAVTDWILSVESGIKPETNPEAAGALRRAQDALAEAMNKMLVAVGVSLVENSKRIGVGILEGVWAGLVDQWGQDQIKGALESNNDYIKRLMEDDFGIDSPSTVFAGYGKNMLQGLVDGIGSMIGPVGTKMGEVVSAVKNSFADSINWLNQKGIDAVQGFINGIGSMIGAAQAKVTELGTLAATALGLSLESQSPSRRFRRYGEWAGQGFIDGMHAKLNEARLVAISLAQTAAQAVQTTVQSVSAVISPAPVSNAGMTYAQQSTALYQAQSASGGSDQANVSALTKYLSAIREDGDWMNDWLTHMTADLKEPLKKYFAAIKEDGDWMNDWLTHLPTAFRGVVKTIGEEMANTLKMSVQSALGIHSPSQYFEWVGEMSAKGFANGFNVGMSSVSAAPTSINNSRADNRQFVVNVNSTGDAVRDIRNQVELYSLTFGGA